MKLIQAWREIRTRVLVLTLAQREPRNFTPGVQKIQYLGPHFDPVMPIALIVLRAPHVFTGHLLGC